MRNTKLVLTLIGIQTCLVTTSSAKPPTGDTYVSTGAGDVRIYTAPNTYTTYATGLNSPGGVAIDRKGIIYVAEIGSNRVLRYTAPNTYTVYGTMPSPNSFAIDGCGNIFVNSIEGGEVRMYKAANTYTVYASGLVRPVSVTLNNDQQLVVAESNDDVNGAIKVYSAPNVFTTFASGLPRLRAISYDSQGTLFAVDNGNPGVVKAFTAANTYTTYASGLASPYGAYVSPSDVVFVADVSTIKTYSEPNVPTLFADGLFYPGSISWEVQFKKNKDCKDR